MRPVYAHENYREFLLGALEDGHGARSALARAAHCSPSWITRVLSGNVQLTPDQAYSIAQYLELSEREADYFLLLVERDRSATPALRKRIEKRCAELRRESEHLSTAVETDFSITEKHRMRYYTSWIFPTVHVACMMRSLSLEEICGITGIPRESASHALEGLLEMGLVVKSGIKWASTSKHIHLPSEHTLTNVMHTSWRQKTTQVLQERGSTEGFHYSGAHSLSRSDLETISGILKEALIKARKTMEPSPSEALAVLCMDWYEV